MNLDQGPWHLVRRGLELKLAALVIFAGLPASAAILLLNDHDLRWLILGLALAAVPDCIGRCLCLAAPLSNRLNITLSVIFQLFAFAAMVGFGYTGDSLNIGVGVGVGGALQLISAILFTRFLQTTGEALGRTDISDRANQVTWRLVCSVSAGTGLGITTFVAAAIVLIVTAMTCGFGFYLVAPLAAIVVIPLTVLTFGLVVGMYWAYGATMVSLRVAILESGEATDDNDA